MSTVDDLYRYSEETNTPFEVAKHRRSKMLRDWVEWCKANGIDPKTERTEELKDNSIQIKGEVDFDTAAESNTAARYKSLEDTAFRQARLTQNLLDDAIADANSIHAIKTLTSAVETQIRGFELATKARLTFEAIEGLFLPITLLEHYRNEYYPKIANGAEQIRFKLLQNLPSEYQAEVEKAWQEAAYPAFVQAVKEAEEGLQKVAAAAPEEARQQIKNINKKQK